MNSLNLSFSNNLLHHAYCILGDSEEVMNQLETLFLKKLNFPIKNNPDFLYGDFDVMDIEDSRAIKNSHQNKPTAGDKKIFIVSANFITEKAQNAMLKLFEEPRGDTHFFLIIPTLNNIIPTFRSRLFIIDTNKINNSLINPKDFLNCPVGKRMEAVKNLCESISDEEESKIEIIKFLNSLEVELKSNVDFLNINEYQIQMFEELEKIRQYASEQSSSLKMLLEHIAIILPIIKS